MPDPVQATLQQGLKQLKTNLGAQQESALLAYLALIDQWNGAYNLTAVRDPAAMVTRHLLDSLAVMDFLPPGSILDVGTGAGLPGVPLAIACPNRKFFLLDSNGKKTRFLFQVKTQLGLNNIEVLETRIEDHRVVSGYAGVISRAFASLDTMIQTCRHVLAPQGVMLAMKASGVHDELQGLKNQDFLVTLREIVVPGLEETRYLAELALPR